jgi:HAD superfamily hydrolase (TIGR01459 family)
VIRTTLASLAPQFDAFLIDQFGVLLNGNGAYEFAPRSLKRLAKLGKPIVLLSNSGKRAVSNETRLSKLGFSRNSYLMVMSSGEAAYYELSRRIGHTLPQRAKIWLHARDNDTSAIDGLDLVRVDSPDDADLLLLAGSNTDTIEFKNYISLLATAAQRRIPMICTNPDLKMLTATASHPGAGAIAEAYAKCGVPVELIGKPYPLIYEEAARNFPGIAPDRILCIGDSPIHDIAGGKAAGHKTALVRTGLHSDITDAELMTFCAADMMPDFILPAFDIQ